MMLRRTKREPDESSDEFFEKVKLPDNWKLLGKNNGHNPETLGFVYQVDPFTVARLFWECNKSRGGIGTRTHKPPAPPKYQCLIWNKRSWQLNEWIHEHLINKEDDE